MRSVDSGGAAGAPRRVPRRQMLRAIAIAIGNPMKIVPTTVIPVIWLELRPNGAAGRDSVLLFASALAGALAAAGRPAAILRVDDFRRPMDWRAAPDEADAYYDGYYDLARLDACLQSFLAGAAAARIPRFSAASERFEGEHTLDFAGAAVAVVEGVFALRVPTIAAAGGLVYLQTSFAEAERRVLARDVARGRAAADVAHRIRARYFPAQRRYLAACDPVARAGALVDNEDLAAPRLGRLQPDRLGGAAVAEAVARACDAAKVSG